MRGGEIGGVAGGAVNESGEENGRLPEKGFLDAVPVDGPGSEETSLLP